MTTIPPRIARALYWTSQGIQGTGIIHRRLRLLTGTQKWPPEQLADLQLRKLLDLLRHAYDTVPYYRALMGQHGIQPAHIRDLDDYRRLPVLTRPDLRIHSDDLVSRAAGPRLQRRQSSGSTGHRVEFIQDDDFDRWCRAHQLRTYSWCGNWRLGESFALVWGAPTYFETQTRANRLDNALTNRVELNAYRLDRASLKRILDQLMRHKPTLISGYTTAIYLLARLALEQGVRLRSLRAVQPNAEPLNDQMRAEIQTGLGCEVFDKYGSRETNIVAHESPDHVGLRIQAEHTYVEFLNDAGQPCRPGQLGRVVVTTLNNRAMPLLRYDIGDLAAPLDLADRVSIGLPAMSPVIGRTHDVLRTPDGGLIHPQLFSNVLRQIPTIAWFQVIQHREDALLLRVVCHGDLDNDTTRKIQLLVAKLAGFPFKVEIERLSDMPETTTGKFRLCVCDLPASSQDRALRHLNEIRAGIKYRTGGPDAP